jgi:hypothetical protein
LRALVIATSARWIFALVAAEEDMALVVGGGVKRHRPHLSCRCGRL